MNLINQTNATSDIDLQKSRWLIAAAAVVMQLCLGTVYAWSVFNFLPSCLTFRASLPTVGAVKTLLQTDSAGGCLSRLKSDFLSNV